MLFFGMELHLGLLKMVFRQMLLFRASGTTMIKILAFVSCILAACSCSSLATVTAPSPSAIVPTETSSPSPDKTALFRQFADAVNKGDVSAALGVFTDDVVWVRGGQCPPSACIGKQPVQREITRDIANHHVVTIIGGDESAGKLNIRIELRNDGTRRANVERIVQIFSLTVRGDKIAGVHVELDTSDLQTAAFLAAQGR